MLVVQNNWRKRTANKSCSSLQTFPTFPLEPLSRGQPVLKTWLNLKRLIVEGFPKYQCVTIWW